MSVAVAAQFAGCRQATVTRSTGTLVLVIDGQVGGLDTEGGRWSTVCEPHGGVISHLTLADARAWAPHPDEWCPYCMGEE